MEDLKSRKILMDAAARAAENGEQLHEPVLSLIQATALVEISETLRALADMVTGPLTDREGYALNVAVIPCG